MLVLTQPCMQHYTASFNSSSYHCLVCMCQNYRYAILYCIIWLIQSNTAYCMQHYTALSDSLVNTDWYVYDSTTIYATLWYSLQNTQHWCNSSQCNTIIFVALYTTFVSTLSLQHISLHYTQHCGSLFLATWIQLFHYTPHDGYSNLCNTAILVYP